MSFRKASRAATASPVREPRKIDPLGSTIDFEATSNHLLGEIVKDPWKNKTTFAVVEKAYGRKVALWLWAHGAVYR